MARRQKKRSNVCDIFSKRTGMAIVCSHSEMSSVGYTKPEQEHTSLITVNNGTTTFFALPEGYMLSIAVTSLEIR